MENIVKIILILQIIILIIISIIDIKEKIISDKLLIVLFFSGIIENIIIGKWVNFYVAMGIYPMPLMFLYMLEDYLKKELVGFGDIKLLIVLGGLIEIKNKNFTVEKIIYNSFNYYKDLYIISGIVIIFLLTFLNIYNKYYKKNIKIEYIAFAPFIISVYFYKIFKFKIN